MEAENNRSSCKRPRQAKPGGGGDRDDEDDDADAGVAARNVTAELDSSSRLLRPWHHPASRIYRVSRASGGKDRHSKVYTSKGLRDRRVRLSVSTAIQFYDLQDRLGYDQPSKAIEWLIKAAASAIAELPSLDSTFPTEADVAAKQELANAADPSYNQHSSASETSKGSVLSLSRSEIRVKARERARERTAKDKDSVTQNLNHGFNSQSSFTELLTGGTPAATATAVGGAHKHTTADYFGTEPGLFGHHQQQQHQHQHQHQQKSTTTANPSAFTSHFGNSSSPIGMLQFGNAGEHHPAEMQQFAFLQQDHFFAGPASAPAGGGGDNYNLNFSISPGLAAGFHRGTLQSNSPSHHHQQHHHHHQQQQVPVQRLSSPLGGSGAIPFLFGTAAAASESQYSAGFDGHLYKHLELEGKGKN